MSNRPRIARALPLLFVIILAACSDTESPLSPSEDETFESTSPSLSISDGAHAGNEHFYFLPPLVKRPSTSGTFDPTQSPVVEICQLVHGLCLNTVATYTMDSGPDSDRIQLNEKREEYGVEWSAQRLQAGTAYRIHVWIGETELGHLDVLLTAKKAESSADWVKIKAGSAVDIRFRIEEGSTPPAGGIILHDNVVPVDSTVLTLVSTESELAAGTYRFKVIGSPVPDISAGDVLAGPEGLGFMRIVTSVKVTGSRVVAETTQATLSDIIKEGGFSISAPLDLSGASPLPSGSAMAPLYYMAPGVSAAGRLFELANVDLCALGGCPEWLSLTLPSGYVNFTPTVDWDYESRLSLTDPVDRFKLVVKSDLVFDVTAKAVASQAFSADTFATLVTIPVPIPLPGILSFLRARADVKLKVGYEAKATVEARVESGIHMESGIEVGGEYTHASGDWTPIWNPTFSVAAKETFWAAQGDGDIRVYVRPEVQLVVSSIEGPYAGVEPYLKAYGAVGTEGCRVRLTWATDADVVLTAKIGRTQLPKLTKQWPGTETAFPEIPCPIGHLKVVTTTSGTSPDPDGYTVTLDGIDPKPAPINGTVVYSPLPPTTYKVELTGLAENCSATSNPRSISVTEGATVLVAFPVTCGEPETGILQVNTTTTGQDDGYTVTTDGASPSSQPIGIEGQVTFDPVIAGNRTVELTGLGQNCSVAGDNPRVVNVAPGATASTDFDVTCGLTVSVTTTGSDPDPDGYTVLLDSAPHPLADVNGSLWFDVAAGPYALEITDAASQCTVGGDNPRTFDAPGETTFDVDCESAITFVRDLNVWQIFPDGTGLQQLTIDGAASVGRYGHVSWSPDGAQMVFTRSMDCGNGHGDCNAIFTADAYGANAAQITFPVSGVGDWRPDWSPDGTRLVFSRIDNRNGWFQTIMTVNPDGTQLIPVRVGDGTNNNYSFPSWTPDGRIVYVNREIGESTDDGYLEIMNADGSGSQRLTSTPAARVYEPDYSPEGDRIVFKSRLYQTQTFFDVMVMNGDGSNLMNLTNQLLDVGAVEWSPDGSRIAYTVAEPSGGLWLMDADGGNRILLTDGIGAAWRILPTP